MKLIALFWMLVLTTNMLKAQEKGDIVLGFSLGASFSNLLNSEAPHKINIFGSDVKPVAFASADLTKSPAYIDYKTGIFKDVSLGVSSGMHIEYFLRNNLSALSGILYDAKGIDLKYSNTITNYISANGELNEEYRIKIRNDYIALPFLLRKYLLKERNLFISGGLYFGYLISSRIDYLNSKKGTDGLGTSINYTAWIDNKKDEKRENTNNLDYGLSFGTGYVKDIPGGLLLKTDLLFNIGLRKVDAKYNNDFSVLQVPSGSNLGNVLVRSTNYYGLNSNSTNLNMSITIGIGYIIGK